MDMLLCTNGSASSKVALRVGSHISLALRAPTTVLGVVEASALEKSISNDVGREADQLRTAGIETEGRIVAGDAQQIIPHEANRGKFLTVFGALEHPIWRRWLRGPTMRHVLDALEVPAICVYHAEALLPIEKILVCSGGLYHANSAVRLAGQLAGALKAKVTLLHVATLYSNMPPQLQDVPESPDAYLEGGTIYAENLREGLEYLRAMDLSVDFRLRKGDPLPEILSELREGDYDLVVVGSHLSVTGPAQLVGDITYRIVENSARPVLVVKNTGAGSGL